MKVETAASSIVLHQISSIWHSILGGVSPLQVENDVAPQAHSARRLRRQQTNCCAALGACGSDFNSTLSERRLIALSRTVRLYYYYILRLDYEA